MGSSKPQPRGKQRRDQNKAKPAVQQHAQPRAAHFAPVASAAPPREVPATPPQAQGSAPQANRVPGNGPRNGAPRPTFNTSTNTAHTRPPEVKPAQTPAPNGKMSHGTPAPEMAAPHPPPAPQVISEEPAVTPVAPPAPSRAAQEPAPTPRHTGQKTPTPPSELSPMFAELRELFVHDRANGARGDAARCGVCYLTFPRDQLTYREDEGFYTCSTCAAALGNHTLPMLRRQRK